MFIFDKGAGISKKITLKIVIQILLWLYNRNISSYLTKTKVLFMTSIGKITFNIDGLTKQSSLNISIQQSLFNLLNLSLDSLNRLTCWYEQLQLVEL
jgi:hypothetical protein